MDALKEENNRHKPANHQISKLCENQEFHKSLKFSLSQEDLKIPYILLTKTGHRLIQISENPLSLKL